MCKSENYLTGYLYNYKYSIYSLFNLILTILSWLIFFVTLKYSNHETIRLFSGIGIFLSMFVFPHISEITNYKKRGIIQFTKTYIKIVENGVADKIFYLKYIDEINLFYYGYKGLDNSSLYRPFDTNKGFNSIILYANNKEEDIVFQITDNRFLGLLIKQWKYLSEPKIRIFKENQKSKIIWTNYK